MKGSPLKKLFLVFTAIAVSLVVGVSTASAVKPVCPADPVNLTPPKMTPTGDVTENLTFHYTNWSTASSRWSSACGPLQPIQYDWWERYEGVNYDFWGGTLSDPFVATDVGIDGPPYDPVGTKYWITETACNIYGCTTASSDIAFVLN